MYLEELVLNEVEVAGPFDTEVCGLHCRKKERSRGRASSRGNSTCNAHECWGKKEEWKKEEIERRN